MLSMIKLLNFKCFQSLKLSCAPLTLLCGLNGMGKSSVIQALLILRQSFLSGDLTNGRLVLGGELIDLGTGVDVLFEGAESDSVGFELHSDEIPTPWALAFDYSKATDQLYAGSSDSDRSTPSRRIQLIAELLKTQETLQQTQYIVTTHSPVLPDLLSDSSLFVVSRSDRNTRIDSFSTWGPLARSSDINRVLSEEQEGLPVSQRILRGDFDA